MSKKDSLNPKDLLEGLYGILKNNGERLDEKAKSISQQHLFGAIKSAQEGSKPISKKIGKLAKDISKTDVRDFAKTKHKGLPEKKIKKEDTIEDESLKMFDRHTVGKRAGAGQGDNPWNHLHKKGRGFKGRTRTRVKEEGDMEECGTLSDSLKAFNLEEAILDMYEIMIQEGKIQPDRLYKSLLETDIHANPNKMEKDHVSSFKGAVSMPGISQNKSNGNAYTQYRFGIALAGAPEYPTQAAGAFAGDPLLSTYTDEELEMVNSAAQMVGAGPIKKLGNNRSTELDNTNTQSAISPAKKNKYGI